MHRNYLQSDLSLLAFQLLQLSFSKARCTQQSTKGRESFFYAYRGIIFFNIFFASIVHHNLLEVEEHDLTESSHSMYSLLEAKAKFQLIFQ